MASLYDILYTSEGQLCSIEIKTKNIRCIESNVEYDSPAWSPDGKAIIVESRDPNGVQNLALLQPNGTLFAHVAKSAGFLHPVWSSEGHHIYAVSQTIGSMIGRWDDKGKNFQLIPVRGIPTLGPLGTFEYIERISLSSNGNSLAILAEGFNRILIAEYMNDAFQVTSQVPEGFASVGMSVWIDGSHLLFVGHKDARRADLFELDIRDGSTQKKEIKGLTLRDSFTLSPDNKSVVLCGISETNKGDIRWNLWHYKFSSAKLTKLTSGDEDLSPECKR